MPFAYYRRLSPRQKRIYQQSVRIERIDLGGLQPGGGDLLVEEVEALESALASGRRRATETAAQRLVDRLTRALSVPSIRVSVRERRPSWTTGELHGLYEPGLERPHRIAVWMRTAQRAQLVKFKTFLRTLLHELCHHLDYERFGLEESFHTEGFYKRESSLMRQLYRDTTAPPRRPTGSSPSRERRLL